MADRHVSRWRLPASSATTDGSPREDAPRGGTNAVSLRYLDEFVRKLQCAPRLLEHQIFPDAKEITESMGLFNAVRRYVITSDSNAGDHSKHAREESSSALADGIVVVGDGNTPRSAAMFAYRLKQWQCYSIDPAMERVTDSARAHGWESIANLVVVRNKIENVHIKLRRAVVVLVHAHVTLAQALGAVECDALVGVVTMPCCNWYGKQEQLFGRPPSIVYDDFSILSDHRELRVWVDPRGDRSLSKTAEAEQLALDQSSAMAKGCVRKEFVADYGVPTRDSGDDTAASSSSGKKPSKKTGKGAPRAVALFRELLTTGPDNVSDSIVGPTRPTAHTVIASTTQYETAAAYIATQLATPSARVLVLTGDGPSHRSQLVRSLLQRGFTNVYGLQLPSQDRGSDDRDDALHATVVKLDLAPTERDVVAPSTVGDLHSMTVNNGIAPGHTSATSIVDASTGQPLPLFDCVVDAGFIYRSLRNQPKKSCGLAFERIVDLTWSMATPTAGPRLLSLSPRKDWRKSEFFANERLAIAFATTTIAADQAQGTGALFVYACSLSSASSTSIDGDEQNDSTTQNQKKQLALQLKKALEDDFTAACAAVGSMAPLTALPDIVHTLVDGSLSSPRAVRVRGVVQHLRRFTTGPSFFSIASTATSPFRGHLQVALDPLRLSRWHSREFVSLDAVLRLLHKSDHVECVGAMARNAHQQPVLHLDALRFLASEFQAYQ